MWSAAQYINCGALFTNISSILYYVICSAEYSHHSVFSEGKNVVDLSMPSSSMKSSVIYGTEVFSHLPLIILPVMGSDVPKNFEVRISVQDPPSS